MSNVTLHIHRFGDLVGVAMPGAGGETVYLTPAEAGKFAKAMNEAARNIRAMPHKDSNLGTWSQQVSLPGIPFDARRQYTHKRA